MDKREELISRILSKVYGPTVNAHGSDEWHRLKALPLKKLQAELKKLEGR